MDNVKLLAIHKLSDIRSISPIPNIICCVSCDRYYDKSIIIPVKNVAQCPSASKLHRWLLNQMIDRQHFAPINQNIVMMSSSVVGYNSCDQDQLMNSHSSNHWTCIAGFNQPQLLLPQMKV